LSNLDFFDMFNLYFGGAPASLVRPEGVASRPYGVKNSAAAKARAGREFLSPNPFPSRPARASGFVPAAPAARQELRQKRRAGKNSWGHNTPKTPSFLPARLCPLRGRAADFKVNALVPTRPYAGI